MKKIISDNKLLSVATILELLAVIFCLVLYMRPVENVVIDESSLTVPDGAVHMDSLMNDDMPGWYVDNSIDMPEGKLTLVTDPVDLHFGSFNVTLKYATNDETNTYSAMSTYNTWPVNTGHSDSPLSTEYSAESGSFDNMCDTESNATFRLDSMQNVKGYQVGFNYLGNGYLYVNGIEIHETNSFKNVFLFWTIALYLLFMLVYTVIRRHDGIGKYAIILTALFILCSLPLTGPYLKDGHDLQFHLARIEGMVAAIRDGQIPVRIPYLWNNGYGYATSVFYSELFLLFPAVLRIIGMTVQGAYKVYVFLMNASACIISFICFNRILKDCRASIVGTEAYVLSPYRICCIYVRAAVGEYSAMTFLPLVIYGMYELYQDNYKKREKLMEVFSHSLPLILGVSAIIECHLLTCVIIMIYIIIVAGLKIKKTLTKTVLKRIFASVAGVLILNLWFIVPMMNYSDSKYEVNTLNRLGDFAANGVHPWQLFMVFPKGAGFSYGIPSELYNNNEMSFSIGGGIIIALVVWAYITLAHYKNEGMIFIIGKYSLTIGLFFMLLSLTWFPWDSIQQLGGIVALLTQSIQFPCRFLGLATVLLSLFCGCVVLVIEEHYSQFYMLIISIMLAFVVISASYEIDCIDREGSWIYYVSDNEVNTNTNEIATGEYFPVGYDKHMFSDKEFYSGEGVEITEKIQNSGTITLGCSNDGIKASYVDVPLLYYKGYNAIVSGSNEELQITSGNDMRIRIVIPSGFSGVISIRIHESLTWYICDIVSALGLIFVMSTCIVNKKNILDKSLK